VARAPLQPSPLKKSPEHLVRFRRVLWAEGKQSILLSTDLSLSSTEIMMTYSWRFKIKVTFRTLIEILSRFSYRFWMNNMARSSPYPKNMNIKDYSEQEPFKIIEKIEAFERFVNVRGLQNINHSTVQLMKGRYV
jgi:hypothetical protein